MANNDLTKVNISYWDEMIEIINRASKTLSDYKIKAKIKRPNKKDYLTTNQIDFDEKLNEYYDELEKYVDYLERQLKTNRL